MLGKTEEWTVQRHLQHYVHRTQDKQIKSKQRNKKHTNKQAKTSQHTQTEN